MGIIKKGLGVVGQNAGHIFMAASIVMDTYSAYKEGKNVPYALAKSTFENFWPMALTAGMTVGAAPLQTALYMLPLIPTAITGAYGAVMSRNQFLQTSTRPFSHQVEHSDFAMMAQRRGMQSINGTRSLLGSEAGALAQRYARRG